MIRFTRHARNRLRFWSLSEVDVEAALSEPDETAPSIRGRANAWKRQGERWLRVTYIREGGDLIIVTVTQRRRGPEGR